MADGGNAMQVKLDGLVSTGVITQKDAETASDVLGQVIAVNKGLPIDPMIPKMRISRLPEPVQQLFKEAA